ncbi:hypothetical protein KAZ92_03330 [Candidatus Gracilibacteria bacterium]|nr:hypothetical protein [Candidatus Gracilibacteria bacterium]
MVNEEQVKLIANLIRKNSEKELTDEEVRIFCDKMKEGKMKIRDNGRYRMALISLITGLLIVILYFTIAKSWYWVLGVGCSLIGFFVPAFCASFSWHKQDGILFYPYYIVQYLPRIMAFSLLINVMLFKFYPGDIALPTAIGSFIIGVYADDIKSVIPKL